MSQIFIEVFCSKVRSKMDIAILPVLDLVSTLE